MKKLKSNLSFLLVVAMLLQLSTPVYAAGLQEGSKSADPETCSHNGIPTVSYSAGICTKDGIEYKTCPDCGTTSQNEISAKGHTYDDGVITTSSNCTNKGVKTFSCIIDGCDAYYTEPVDVDPSVHNIVDMDEVPATCSKNGLKGGKKCSLCGTEITAPVATDLSSHTTGQFVIEKESNCVSTGLSVQKCSVCGVTLSSNTIPVVDKHNWGPYTEVSAPSCTDKGTVKRVCSDCKKEETADVSMLEHSLYVSKEAKEPTCTEAGWTEEKKCSGCKNVIVESVSLNAKGHDHQVVTPQVNATCTEAGKEAVKKCTRCGDLQGGNSIKALGHNVVTIAGKAATCIEDGKTESRECSLCHEVYKQSEVIPALGHIEVKTADVPATCLKEGSKGGTICSRCKSVLEAPAVINKKEHTIEEIPAVPAKCGYNAFTAGKKCSVCKTVLEAPQEIIGSMVQDHNFASSVVNRPSTCEKEGEKEYICSSCGETRKEITPLADHKWGEWFEASASTCTTKGKEKRTCKLCGKIETRELEIDSEAHTYGKWTVETAATCMQKGVDKMTCTQCGKVIRKEVAVNPYVHDYDDGTIIKAPTCYEKGTRRRVCRNNLEHTKLEDVSTEYGHSYIEWKQSKEPTCSVVGVEESICTICGHVGKRYTETVASNHQLSGWLVYKAANCSNEGIEKNTCLLCGNFITRSISINAAVHEFNSWNETVNATCVSAGTEERTCKDCGIKEVRDKEINPKGHKYEWMLIESASCNKTGKESGICLYCGDKQERVTAVDTSLHKYGDWKDVLESTCAVSGRKERVCSVCEVIQVQVLPKLQHVYGESQVLQDPTCIATGVEISTCSQCGAIKNTPIAINKDNHLYGDEWEEIIPATASSNGLKRRYCIRENCGHYEDAIIDRYIACLKHEKVVNGAKAPSCTVKGSTATTKCKKCGLILIRGEVLEKLPHTEEKIPVVDPTCETAGSKDGVKCSVCSEIINKPVTITALGHNKQTIAGKEATCTEDGKTPSVICTVCDKVLDAGQVIPKTGHEWCEYAVSEATCSENGVKILRCHNTGCTAEEKVIVNALGHKFGEYKVLTEPTCYSTGLQEHQCSVCNTIEKTPIEALPHNFDEGTIIKTPTCLAFGTRRFYCKTQGCSATKDVDIEKAAHNKLVSIDRIDPTCTQPGYEEGKRCSWCNVITYPQVKIDALGHDYTDWIVGEAATKVKEGYEYRDCKRCELHETRITEKVRLGYRLVFTDGQGANKCEYNYTGKAINPKFEVFFDGEPLSEGIDYTVKISKNINASTQYSKPSITIKGKGNFGGSAVFNFDINKADINDAIPEGYVYECKYGATIAPTLVYKGTILKKGTDYRLSVAKNKSAEDSFTVEVTGLKNFADTEGTITVKTSDEKLAKISAVYDTRIKPVYNGENHRDEILAGFTVKVGNTVLSEDEYTIIGPDEVINAGKYSFIIVPTASGLSGYVKKDVNVYSATVGLKTGNARMNDVEFAPVKYVSTGASPAIDSDCVSVVLNNGETSATLTEGIDYTVKFTNNKKVSKQAKVTFKFKGNYSGSVDVLYEITPADMSKAKIVATPYINYKKAGVYKPQKVFVTYEGVALKTSDYQIAYYTDEKCLKPVSKDNPIVIEQDANSTEVYCVVSGKMDKNGSYIGNFDGEAYGSFLVTRYTADKSTDLKNAIVTINKTEYGNKTMSSFEYSGDEYDLEYLNALGYKVTVKLLGKDITEDVDIKLVNSRNVGTASIVVLPGENSIYKGSKIKTMKVTAYQVRNAEVE